jgi:hypothetical protein
MHVIFTGSLNPRIGAKSVLRKSHRKDCGVARIASGRDHFRRGG